MPPGASQSEWIQCPDLDPHQANPKPFPNRRPHPTICLLPLCVPLRKAGLGWERSQPLITAPFSSQPGGWALRGLDLALPYTSPSGPTSEANPQAAQQGVGKAVATQDLPSGSSLPPSLGKSQPAPPTWTQKGRGGQQNWREGELLHPSPLSSPTAEGKWRWVSLLPEAVISVGLIDGPALEWRKREPDNSTEQSPGSPHSTPREGGSPHPGCLSLTGTAYTPHQAAAASGEQAARGWKQGQPHTHAHSQRVLVEATQTGWEPWCPTWCPAERPPPRRRGSKRRGPAGSAATPSARATRRL